MNTEVKSNSEIIEVLKSINDILPYDYQIDNKFIEEGRSDIIVKQIFRICQELQEIAKRYEFKFK